MHGTHRHAGLLAEIDHYWCNRRATSFSLCSSHPEPEFCPPPVTALSRKVDSDPGHRFPPFFTGDSTFK
jgi:hypothetical protein